MLMKLEALRSLTDKYGDNALADMDYEGRRAVLKEIWGIDPNNIYQELEMSDRYVNTQEDTSYGEDCVGLHSHIYYEIIFVCSGNLQYQLGTKLYRVNRGDIIIIPPGTAHQPLFPGKLTEPYHRYVIWASAEYIATAQANWPDLVNLFKEAHILRAGKDERRFLQESFWNGIEEAKAGLAGWRAVVYGNTLALLVQMNRLFVNGRAYLPIDERESLFDRIISYVDDHLDETLTIARIASAFHVSTSTVAKLFHNRLRTGFYHYVLARRLISAKSSIIMGKSMAEAAYRSGFTDYSAFFRAFKKEYGISPRAFKKLNNV